MFIKKINLFLVSVIFVSCNSLLSSHMEAASIEVIRQKWREWANALVITERDKILALYGLSADMLKDLSVDKFKANSDAKAEEIIFKDKLVVNQEKSPQIKAVESVAKEIFGEDVQIIHEPELSVDCIGVFKHFATNTAYVALNCDKCLEDIDCLREILRHEYSHVLHSDNINEDIIQCLCWMALEADRDTLQEQTIPYHRAFETRADVYAATTSPNHGKHLKKFLAENCVDSDSHPTTAERVALLEKIEAELNMADKD